MFKYTCDICGKDIPSYVSGFNAVQIGAFSQTKDVCDECVGKIIKFIEDLKCQEQ